MKRSAVAFISAAGGGLALAGAVALAQSSVTAPPPSQPSDSGSGTSQPSSPSQPGEVAPPAGAVPPAAPEQNPNAAGSNETVPGQAVSTPSTTAQGQNVSLPPAPVPMGPPRTPANAVLVMTGLDKITGRPTRIVARLNQPVEFATLTITARYCYSTPPSETPETSAFLQIDDHRPDQPERRVFSGWMYASSPGLNGLQHPLYDVWVISCSANAPGQVRPTVASSGPAKVLSPDSTDAEKMPSLPEGAGQ